ncbi:MAG TPA: hypothetical protein DHU69_06485 [Deltaproteobacteria bacterium]|nr:hypothetical protein [Deltaproteobacteria bacterium]
MDKDKPIIDPQLIDNLIVSWTKIGKNKVDDSQLKIPSPDALDKILEQRQTQREVIFDFALRWTKFLLILLIVVIVFQSAVSFFYGKSLIDKVALSILAVSILGQFIGVIIIIAKALWNDDPYKEHFNKDKK